MIREVHDRAISRALIGFDACGEGDSEACVFDTETTSERTKYRGRYHQRTTC
jgi:hypothetical protein